MPIACVDARARDPQRVQRDVAFVEARDELAAHARREHARRAPREQRADDRGDAEPQRRAQQRLVSALARAHDGVLVLRDPAANEHGHRGGHERDAKARARPSAPAMTVSAIGWNIFPSTPESAKIGR